jgi:hypothetical protein
VKTLPDDPVSLDNHCADHRIRTGRIPALRRQTKGQSHEVEVSLSAGHRLLRREADGFRDAAGFFPAGFAREAAMAACAAANRAIATRKGEQLT